MKSTTTVTTSSYYGNLNTNNHYQNVNQLSQQKSISKQTISENKQLTQFITPQQMLKRLIPYSNAQSARQQQQTSIINLTNNQSQKSLHIQKTQKTQLITQIQALQSQLNNIHAEIIESQNLLNVRDSLYGQLDMLRQQRELIQGDIAYLQSYNSQSKEIKINIKPKQGYKEMNQRLRRRMNEIREYIYKMQLENKKIQENINYTNLVENTYNNIRQQQSMMMTMGGNYQRRASVDNGYYGANERGMGRVDQLITRLHHKQEEALEKVRRQEEEINRRNNFNRASFASNHISSNTGLQFQARTYYPQSEIGNLNGRASRFYSPEYRY